MDFSPELQLLLACATAYSNAETLDVFHRPGTTPLDYGHLLHLAALHGTRPLLDKHYSAHLPEPHKSQLKRSCQSIAAHNRFLTGELFSILDLFSSVGISAILMKGPALAVQLFGDIALREFSDLDLLLPKDCIWPAADLLRSHGYQPLFFPTDWRRQAFLENDCELMLTHPAGMTVELHWDFAPPWFRFPLHPSCIRPIQVDILGRPVPTLSLPDACLLACGHAAKHGRLSAKWTGEIATLLSRLNYDPSSARTLLFASTLAARLHGLPEPAQHDSVEPLVSRSAAWLASGNVSLLSTWEAVSYHLELTSGLRDRLRLLAVPFTPSAVDWEAYSVPRSLSFLYWLTMPFRRLRKHFLP